MIVYRKGSKKLIAKEIIKYFLPHNFYVEMFFGVGELFFEKQKIMPCNYNILNDLDSDVYNLFRIFQSKTLLKKLYNKIKLTPISEKLFRYFMKKTFKNKINRALRFIYIFNFSYLGKADCFHIGKYNVKKNLLKDIKNIFNRLKYCYFTNSDYKDLLNKIAIGSNNDRNNMFIYCDPPYINTSSYDVYDFTIQDFENLVKILIAFNVRFAISEFDNKDIIEICKKYNLNIIDIGSRRNLKNVRNEILITNYKQTNLLF